MSLHAPAGRSAGRALGLCLLAVASLGAVAPAAPAAAQDLAVPDEILSQIERVVGMPSTVARRGLEFEINSPNGSYREGDFAEFRITAPDYDAYIYLDYYQIDGNVVHILPGPGEREAVPRGQTVEIGTPESGVSYEILPPFGRELLVLMAAAQPLFDEPRREFEFAPLYLEDLDRGIERLRRSGLGPIAVIYRAIQTHPRDAVIAAAPQAPDRPSPAPQPRVVERAPEPQAAPPAPQPLVVQTAPRVAEPAPAPQVAATAPAPQVAATAPAPQVVEPTPAPQAAEPAPAPQSGGTAGGGTEPADEPELPPAPVVSVTASAPPQPAAPAPAPSDAALRQEIPAAPPAPAQAPEPSEPAPSSLPAPAPAPAPAAIPQQTAALPAVTPPPEPPDEVSALRQRIGELNKQVQLAPNDMVLVRELATTYRDHALLMFDRGDYEKANLSLSMVTALDVTNAELVAFAEDLRARIAVRRTYEEGLNQIGLGQVALAYEAFQDVLSLDPGNSEARKRMSELAPEVTELYHKEALSAARRQDLDRAVEIWDKVLTIDPDFEEAKLKRVEALRRKKRLEQLPSVQ